MKYHQEPGGTSDEDLSHWYSLVNRRCRYTFDDEISLDHIFCRTKNTTNIELVGEENYLCKVEFPEGDHKKRIHDVLYNTTQAPAFNAVAQNDFDYVTLPHFGMLELGLRVCQACCSGDLIHKERFRAVSRIALKMKNCNGDLSVTEKA
jgi:hypothetical protein